MGSLVSREEIRRLEKAAREKDKTKLIDWIRSFESQLDNKYRHDYEKAYQLEVNNTIQNTFSAIVYALYFSEENYIDKENIADFMADLFVTLDMFRTGEYTPQEYKDILAKERVSIDDYDADLIYKKYLNMFDTDLVRFLKGNHRKIITVVGSKKFNDDINIVSTNLSIQGNLVFNSALIFPKDSDGILKEEGFWIDEAMKDKILISDILYVCNKDKYIGETTQSYIDYAKEHNKEIKYLENI